VADGQYETPYVESYLQETASDAENSRDLLWKFYARKEEYLSAAKALEQLATRSG
jgi:nuclear pore complex protein Nup155